MRMPEPIDTTATDEVPATTVAAANAVRNLRECLEVLREPFGDELVEQLNEVVTSALGATYGSGFADGTRMVAKIARRLHAL